MQVWELNTDLTHHPLTEPGKNFSGKTEVKVVVGENDLPIVESKYSPEHDTLYLIAKVV